MSFSIDTILSQYKDNSLKERDLQHFELCRQLTPIMNEVHSLEYSERFWTILLSYYVKSCLSLKNYYCSDEMPASPLFLPINGWVPPSRKQIIQSNILYFLRAMKLSKSLRTISKILKNHDDICIGNRGPLMEKYGIGVSCPPYYIIPKPFNKVTSKRKQLLNIANKQGDVFFKNIIKNIPTYYIEYFDYVVSKIPLYQPENKVFHSTHTHAFMEFVEALYIEHGARLYEYQDGGFIGETYQSVCPVNYFKYDKHRTYGWVLTDKDEPFYALRIQEFQKKYKNIDLKKENDILIVYNNININKKKWYYNISKKIFEQLDRKKFPKIKLRPRGTTKFLSNKNDLVYLSPPTEVKIDKGKVSLADLVKKSKIVIHLNHPSTNFLECVYVDHPVVAILTNSYPTHIVEPYYKFFLENGVMHTNVESLIEHLNEVHLNEWWQIVTQKPLYIEFKNNFARSISGNGSLTQFPVQHIM